MALTSDRVSSIRQTRRAYAENLRRFIEDQLWIIDRESATLGDRMVPFKIAPSQEAVLRHRDAVMDFNKRRSAALAQFDPRVRESSLPVRVIYLKARKVMVSTIIQAIGFHQCEFYPGTNMVVLAHEKPAAQNLARISATFDARWNPNTDPPIRTPIVRNSDELIEWDPDHNSRIIVQTAGGRGAGSSRSFTWQFMHFSEAALYPEDSPQLATAMQAASAYCEQHLESTARGENEFFKTWKQAMWLSDAEALFAKNEPMPADWNGFFRWFWAWWQDPNYRRALFPYERAQIERTLDDDERELQRRFNLDLEQLAWRRDKINGDCSKQTEMEPRQYFRQEYPSFPEEAFVAKGRKAFPDDCRKWLKEMEAAAESIHKALTRGERTVQGAPEFFGNFARDRSLEEGWKLIPAHFIEGATFVQWKKPEPNKSYLINGDAAEGLEHGDDSAFTVWDRTDGLRLEEVARYIGKADPEELAELIYYTAGIYNDGFVAMERNKPGNATCMKLVNLGCANMYHHKSIEEFKDRENPEAFTAGFATTPATKPVIVARMITRLRDRMIYIRSLEALRQYLAYENNDAKYAAPSGDKDDAVTADMIGGFCVDSAPPVWLNKEEPEPEEFLPKTEPDQNEYWRDRVKKLKEKCRARNEREDMLRTGKLLFTDEQVFD